MFRHAATGTLRAMKVELSLVALHGDFDANEVRRHWNGHETPTLDAAVGMAPKLRLGPVEVPVPDEANKGGPAGRVSSLLFLRGTTPDYVLPRVDEQLSRELLECIEPAPGDPYQRYATPQELAAFLQRNRGAGVTTEEARLVRPWRRFFSRRRRPTV
jgi:hypothetical protein